ncbi:alpha/beta hydrolase fold-domain-containing protein [Gloeopeniophorella convolvens]|nr:alpha/beta hydrolase fold-domain-containing protein [Gloeopeniophorella convolvens]
MSQYAHLSEPDPEFVAYLKDHPREILPIPTADQIPGFKQGFIDLLQAPFAAFQKSHAKLRVQEYKIPVEGGEILVRAVIPGTGEGKEQYPLLFWTHGGGFVVGTVDLDDYFLRNLSAELQVTTLNVEYRLAPAHTYPTALNDSYAALKWSTLSGTLRQAVNNTDTLSVSLKKGFIVGGCSAGGNLAAALSLRARDDSFFHPSPITGQYLYCPFLLHYNAYDRFPGEQLSLEQNKDAPGLTKEIAVWFIDTYKAPGNDPELSPALAKSHAGLPPAFLQVAGRDPIRDDSFLYDRLLREAGVKTRVNVYLGLPHGFAMEYFMLKSAQQFELDVRTGLRWLLSREKA